MRQGRAISCLGIQKEPDQTTRRTSRPLAGVIECPRFKGGDLILAPKRVGRLVGCESPVRTRRRGRLQELGQFAHHVVIVLEGLRKDELGGSDANQLIQDHAGWQASHVQGSCRQFRP